VPALQPYVIEPIWEQFSALLPERSVDHPLGCYRSRIPDRVVFEKLVGVLVFGCAYWRIADEQCSATTLRRRRDEWIEAGLMETLRQLTLEAYDRFIGLELSDLAVDCCITKAPCGGEKAGKTRWTEEKGASSVRRWSTEAASLSGPSSPRPIATTRRFWRTPSALWRRWESCLIGRVHTSTAPTTRTLLARSWKLTA
jgi:transposase